MQFYKIHVSRLQIISSGRLSISGVSTQVVILQSSGTAHPLLGEEGLVSTGTSRLRQSLGVENIDLAKNSNGGSIFGKNVEYIFNKY